MNFPKKSFKTTEKYGLEVCGSLFGEKQFLLIFIPFYWFNQKKLFKQIQIFLRFFPFLNKVRKKISDYFSTRFCYNNFYV